MFLSAWYAPQAEKELKLAIEDAKSPLEKLTENIRSRLDEAKANYAASFNAPRVAQIVAIECGIISNSGSSKNSNRHSEAVQSGGDDMHILRVGCARTIIVESRELPDFVKSVVKNVVETEIDSVVLIVVRMRTVVMILRETRKRISLAKRAYAGRSNRSTSARAD